MKVYKSTVRKHIEQKLEVYSIDELMKECRKILKELINYEHENKFQIKYYKLFWNLLIEY